MDSLIAAAARALVAGDVLGALKRVALRDDPPAPAPRGIAMAHLGERPRARGLLRRAARGFGAHEELARARCVVAEAEVALAMRDLRGSPRTLAAALATLEARADRANALQARLIAVRRLLLLGRLDEAASALARLDARGLPPSLLAGRPPPQRVAPGAPARRDRPFARARRAAGAHRGQRARLRAHAARRARRRPPGGAHRRRSGVAPGAARRRRGLVHLGPGAGPRGQPAHGPARARRAGGRRTGALDRASAGAALAVAAAGRIHDDLVPPRRAVARVDWSCGAVPKCAARSQAMTRTPGRISKTKPQAPARAAEIVREYGPFAGADRIHGVTYYGPR